MNINRIDNMDIDYFMDDYKKLCLKYNMYLVYEDIWLQQAGELLDIEDSVYHLDKDLRETEYTKFKADRDLKEMQNVENLYCCPSYCKPAYILRYEDNDVSDIVTYDKERALSAFINANNRGYNCHLFETSKRTNNKENIMEINEIANRQYDWVERMNWHHATVLESLALVASEVGEAVNECRGLTPTKEFGSELADIILRTLDISVKYGVDIGDEIEKKMAINEARGTRGRII